MKKIIVAFLLLGAFVATAQEVKKDEIKKEVVRILDSINSVNKEKQVEKEKQVAKEKVDKEKDVESMV